MADQTTHSPGPWRLEGGYREVILDANGRPVAVSPQAASQFDTGGVFRAGDAALIASAPDLLAQRDRLLALVREIYVEEDAWMPELRRKIEAILDEPWAKAALAELDAKVTHRYGPGGMTVCGLKIPEDAVWHSVHTGNAPPRCPACADAKGGKRG